MNTSQSHPTVKKYYVGDLTYTYYNKESTEKITVTLYDISIDSLAEIQDKLKCDLGQIMNLRLGHKGAL